MTYHNTVHCKAGQNLHPIRTRKEAILIAEAFLYSAFLGLSVVKSDKKALSAISGGLKAVILDQISSEFDVKARPSLQDLHNAAIWAETQPKLGLSVREGKLLYLRAYVGIPWKGLAERFSMAWDGVRREYDNCLYEVYRKVIIMQAK